MRNIIKTVLFLVFIVFVILEWNKVIENPQFVKGVIVKSYYNKGSNYRFRYIINDKEYFLTKRAYISGLLNGEIYLIKYDSLNPNNAEANLKKPFFTDTINYKIINAKVVNIEDKQHNRIELKYIFDSKIYKRVQYSNQRVFKGDVLELYVNIKNPKISYINQ